MIFNIVTDAIIWGCEKKFLRCDPRRLYTIDVLFYAGDGVIAGEEPSEVEYLLDLYTENFARVGLKMNAEKTESLIMNGGKVCKAMSTYAYQRHVTGIGGTRREMLKESTICQLCGAQVSNKNIAWHQMTKKCELD
jgi:hypothetical protein